MTHAQYRRLIHQLAQAATHSDSGLLGSDIIRMSNAALVQLYWHHVANLEAWQRGGLDALYEKRHLERCIEISVTGAA